MQFAYPLMKLVIDKVAGRYRLKPNYFAEFGGSQLLLQVLVQNPFKHLHLACSRDDDAERGPLLGRVQQNFEFFGLPVVRGNPQRADRLQNSRLETVVGAFSMHILENS